MTLLYFINQEAWDGWCEIRSAMKRIPFTERAKNIALHRLEEWHMLGYDCNFILDHATLSGWRGLYLPPETPRNAPQAKPTANVQQMNLVNLAIEESERTGQSADAVLARLRASA